jgi:two-component SAPR family response regulator
LPVQRLCASNSVAANFFERISIVRLVVLMIEVEMAEGVSARKLVLETARHNVITAYHTKAGLDLLKRFPNVDVAVIHTEMECAPFHECIEKIKQIRADLPVIGISPNAARSRDGADYMISSFEPHELLRLLADKFEK